MAFSINHPWPIIYSYIITLIAATANGANIYLEWHVAIETLQPTSVDLPVITINGMFPGPLINATTNDTIHVNVFNDMDEALLFTWNGIHQRLNSWQDGVSGTNCPILPGKNWTYEFQTNDQIGSFFYFPSINFHKAAGGYGPIRVNNPENIKTPFPKPEAEFDLLIGGWYEYDYKFYRGMINYNLMTALRIPDWMLINGKGSYMKPEAKAHESFNITKGKTYLFRVSNVGVAYCFNFMIQNHSMVLVETEGSYTNQIKLNSLDIHVGQSYTVLVTADQDISDYFIVATPKPFGYVDHYNITDDDIIYIAGLGVLHYDNSTTPPEAHFPILPDIFDQQFSVNQAKSIRLNVTAGAARPNPHGHLTNVTLSQTFILHASMPSINGASRYAINNVSFLTLDTPLKLADYYANGSGFYELDAFPIDNTAYVDPVRGVFVATGNHKGWTEIVFKNDLDSFSDAWHLDGFGFYVVGFGDGEWTPESRSSYNLFDPILRSTVQVYIRGWTAVYVYLDNPGMWNLRSQLLGNWYMGQELYLRVTDADPNSTEEQPPYNLLLCGKYETFAPAPKPIGSTSTPLQQISWLHILTIYFVTILYNCLQ